MHAGSRVLNACLSFGGRTMAEHHFLSTRTLGGKFQITFLKQMQLGKGCREKAFPEGELNVIFCISVYIVKMTVPVSMGTRGDGYDFMNASKTIGGLIPKGASERTRMSCSIST